MANITYSPRNNPTTTQGTVEPIKLQVTTQKPGPNRSQVGMSPRATTAPITTEQPLKSQTASPVPNQPVKASLEETAVGQSPKPNEDPMLSSKFAALARKEKAIRQRQLEIQSFESEREQLRKEVADAKVYRERLRSHPLDVLNEEGVTYDQLVERAKAMVDPSTKQSLDLQDKITKLEESIQKQQEEAQRNATTQRDQAVKQISMDVQSLIDSDPAYETVRDFGYGEAITELITRTYDEEGHLLTTEQAAKQVEDYLKSEITRLSSIPSAKKLLTPAQAVEQAAIESTKQPVEQKIKTLSHAMAPSGTPGTNKTWAQKKAEIVAKYSKKQA